MTTTATASDLWQSSLSNNNTNYQPVYFPPSFDLQNSNPYYSIDNHHFDYALSIDTSSTHLIEPFANLLPSNYSMNPYSAQTVYNTTSIEPSTYITPTDSYQALQPIYTDSNVVLPSALASNNTQYDYQSTMPQWDLDTIKISNHDSSMYMNSLYSTSRNGCQSVL